MLTQGQKNGDFSYLFTNDGTTDARGIPPGSCTIPRREIRFPEIIWLPPGLIDPVAQNIVNTYMPLPNLPGATTPNTTNYAGHSRGDLTVHQAIIRVDQYFSASDQLFRSLYLWLSQFSKHGLESEFQVHRHLSHSQFRGAVCAHLQSLADQRVSRRLRPGECAQLGTHRTPGFIESLGIMGMKVNGPNGRPLARMEEGFPLVGHLRLPGNGRRFGGVEPRQ